MNRKMNVVLTLMLNADVDVDAEGKTEVVLRNVGNTVMASMIFPPGDDAQVDPEYKNAVASAIVKGGLQFMINDMEGKHAERPPEVNQPGASA